MTVRRWDGSGHRLDQPSSGAARLWWVLTIWSEEALLEGRGGGRGPGGHAQLGQDVLHVPGNGVLAEVQRASDVSVVLAGRDQPQHLDLAMGQHPPRCVPALEQGRRVVRVGGGAEVVEPSPSGVDLNLRALLVAEQPLGRADQQPGGGLLIWQPELPPAAQGTAELLQRGRWTPRGELEKLPKYTAGKINLDNASSLHLSEHTVARHMQNILAKLGVSSRAAATSSALKQGLL
jgi:hypothetical protein